MKKAIIDMNTDTSATHTIQEDVSMQKLEQGEHSGMPSQDASGAECDFFLFNEIWKVGENVSSIATTHGNL